MNNRTYNIEIDSRILELLGPNLYTNIYYVLAELIANAYDADAHNVYIFSEDNAIRIEDDGHGMSYSKGGIGKYLSVAKLSRLNDEDTKTTLGRLKMGRKGIGKLAALSVSENVNILTVADGEKSGFVLTRHPGENGQLQPIPEEEIVFKKVRGNGTAVVMLKPQYKLHKTPEVIRRNIVNIFPLVDSDFRIHIIDERGKDLVAERWDEIFASSLCAIITLGKDFEYLASKVRVLFPSKKDNLIDVRSSYKTDVDMLNNNGDIGVYELEMRGWIGAYESSSGRKKDESDFPDNFISLYSHNKMGEFNILPKVGKNSLNEVYIVGQLYIDLFEKSDLPDMALSNRQGYKSDDPRYIKVIEYVRRTLLPEILNKRVLYTSLKNANSKKKQLDRQRKEEDKLKRNVDRFTRNASGRIVDELYSHDNTISPEDIKAMVDKAINDNLPDFRLKKKVDAAKKKLLISQTRADKPLSDLVYHFLLFNGVPAEEIIYSNSDDEKSRIPHDVAIYDYLRDFFVNSYSDEKIYVIFVTSEHIKGSFGAMSEVGAAWITRADHKIINIKKFRPEKPLDDSRTWQNTSVNNNIISMDKLNADLFCSMLEDASRNLGYSPKDRSTNMKHLSGMITIDN